MKPCLMQRIIFVFVSLWVLISCGHAPQYDNRAEAIAAQIHDPHSKYVVVISHRGDWRNFPENSIPAIESVIRMGCDVVEIDIHMTADSVLVLGHDDDVRRMSNFWWEYRNDPDKSARFEDLTLEEIKRLGMNRAHAISIDTLRFPTLEEALMCTKDRICVNIDKGYKYYDQVMKIAEKLGVTDQILIKGSRPIESVARQESRYTDRMMYMPIIDVQTEKGQKLLDSYMEQGVVPVAYELCWKDDSDNAFMEACQKVISQGARVWVNTLWPSLCGGYGNDDDAAFMADDPGDVYGQYLDAGVSMIQTDRPELLIDWLTRQGRHTL